MTKRYLDGLALGLASGFWACTAILGVLEATSEVFTNFKSEHVTHIVTVSAAALALFGISRQIQSNVDLAETTRLAKLDAAKASLPIVLSNITALCKQRYYGVAFGNSQPANDAKWEINEFEISTLKDCVEHSNGLEKRLLLDIIRVYQVLIVRWDDLEQTDLFAAEPITSGQTGWIERLELHNSIAGWMALEAICSSLFAFARGASSDADFEVMRSNVVMKLHHMNTGGLTGSGGLSLTNKSDYYEFVQRKEEDRTIPFIDTDWS